MRYKPYFVVNYKPNIRFPKTVPRQARKKRLKLKRSRLKAKRIKNVDSKIKKNLTSALLFTSICSYIFPPLAYLSIAVLGAIFIAALISSLINKNEKQYEVI